MIQMPRFALLAVQLFGDPVLARSVSGDGSSGGSLPVYRHPDSPHMAAAAGWRWSRDIAGSEWQPVQPAGLPLALPLQTRHQLQDYPVVSHPYFLTLLLLGESFLSPNCQIFTESQPQFLLNWLVLLNLPTAEDFRIFLHKNTTYAVLSSQSETYAESCPYLIHYLTLTI